MSIKHIVVIAGVLVAAGLGSFVFFNNQGSDDTTASHTKTSSGLITAAESATEQSISTLAGLGKARQCTFSYSTASGTTHATAYTDGKGKSRMDMQTTTTQGSTVNLAQYLQGTTSYTVMDANGKKIGYKMDVSKVTTSTTSSAANSSTQGVRPDTNYKMQCQNWSVDQSMLAVPTDVEFMTIPTSTTP